MFHHTGPEIPVEGGVISRAGSDYFMQPGMVYRPDGTPDHLIMLFDTPARVDGVHGAHYFDTPSIIWWTPWAAHHYGHAASTWCHSWIHGRGPLLDELALLLPTNTPKSIPHAEPVRRVFHWIRDLIREDPRPRLLSHTIRALPFVFSDTSTHCLPADSRIPQRLQAAKDRIEREFTGNLPISELAREAGISPSHFTALFKSTFKTTPKAYQTHLRIQEALWLMRDHNLSLKEIAFRVGFRNYPQFSHLIQVSQGKAPRDLRYQT